MDEDLEQMSREGLVAEVERLRQGIRRHRDSTGHELCWHHPDLWARLPGATDPLPAVPDWPQFLQGCIRYRQSLDEQAPHAPRTSEQLSVPEEPVSGASAEHRRLQQFIGHWKTEGTVRVDAARPAVRFDAVDTYEWVPGGFFVLHRWDAQMPDGRTQGVEIIGYDASLAKYTVHSYDSAGNTDVMTAAVTNDTWTFEGKTLRFTGSFQDGGKTLTGVWDKRTDERAAWERLMHVRPSKIS